MIYDNTPTLAPQSAEALLSVQDCIEHWKWLCKYKPPRTMLLLMDVAEARAIQSCGMEILGYAPGWLPGLDDIRRITHENQRHLASVHTHNVLKTLSARPELLKNRKVVYCNTRGLRDHAGQYWRVHQLSAPVQFDEQGRLAAYISYYTILGPYHGEPFETAVYPDPRFPADAQRLQQALNKIKSGILENLGFSRRQEELIQLMAQGASAKDIAITMRISDRTVDKHRLGVLQKGRDLFPLNAFTQAADVVDFLKKQGLV